MDEFIDFCILCGCDYCDTIKGIGSKTAYNLIKEYNCIENIIKNIDQNKYQVPANFKYVEARQSFIKPKVLEKSEVKIDWCEPKIEELKKFLIKEHNFNEVRVTNYITRLLKARKVTTQRRLDTFFTTCTKKSTKLIIEENQKEVLKTKSKGKKREINNDNSTKLNAKKKKTNVKDEKKNNEKVDEPKNKPNENLVKDEDDQDDYDQNIFDERTNSESGNIKNENVKEDISSSDITMDIPKCINDIVC